MSINIIIRVITVKVEGSASKAPGVMPFATNAPPTMPKVNTTRQGVMLFCTNPFSAPLMPSMRPVMASLPREATPRVKPPSSAGTSVNCMVMLVIDAAQHETRANYAIFVLFWRICVLCPKSDRRFQASSVGMCCECGAVPSDCAATGLHNVLRAYLPPLSLSKG